MSNFSQITKVAAALAALAGAFGGGAPYAVNPTDPQIAHIAYTAGQTDIAAARTLGRVVGVIGQAASRRRWRYFSSGRAVYSSLLKRRRRCAEHLQASRPR
jgi:hypothetical protein